jgi:hypothetical protein
MIFTQIWAYTGNAGIAGSWQDHALPAMGAIGLACLRGAHGLLGSTGCHNLAPSEFGPGNPVLALRRCFLPVTEGVSIPATADGDIKTTIRLAVLPPR